MFNFFGLFLFLLSVNCIIDPSNFSQQLHSMTPSGVTIVQHDLGRTVNGYNIIAYGLTSINPLPEKMDLKSFSSYPSSVILSYMHGKDENAFNLLYGYIANLLRVYEEDIYIQMVLKTGIIWLVPFISIEAFQMRAKQVGSDKMDFANMTMKNMNKFPDKNDEIDCENKFPGKFSGVNINYNFLIQSQQIHLDPCSNEYSGPSQYSQRQTMAIKKLFDTLKISTVIDLQIGQDTWVYPYQQIWAQSHKFNYLYKDIIQKIKKASLKLSEQPTKKIVLKKSTQKKTIQKDGFSGGFVNWAALKGSLAFKYLITSQEKGEKLIKSVSNAYSVMDMLIKKNAPIYNKYRSQDNKQLYIQSISLSKFIIKCQVLLPGQTKSKQYQVNFGKMVEMDVVSKYSKNTKIMPQIRLSVVGTPITEVVQISQLASVQDLPSNLVPVQKVKENVGDEESGQGGDYFTSSNVLSILVVGTVVGCLVKLYSIKSENARKYYVNIDDSRD